jgi:hypothetical protein
VPPNGAASLPPSSYRPISELPRSSLRDLVEQQLAQKLEANDATLARDLLTRHDTEVSSWLDATNWSEYLQGHDLARARQLIDLPDCV